MHFPAEVGTDPLRYETAGSRQLLCNVCRQPGTNYQIFQSMPLNVYGMDKKMSSSIYFGVSHLHRKLMMGDNGVHKARLF